MERRRFARLFGKVVRTLSAVKNSLQMQIFFVVVGKAWTGTSSCRRVRFTESDDTAKILEDAAKLGVGPIRVCTLQDNLARNQIPKCCRNNSGMLERELIGSLLSLAGANGFEKGNQAHSRFSRTLS